MKRLLDVLHPFFIALSPVLFLYAYNVEQVLVGDTLISALIVLVLAIIVLGLFSAIFRDLRKGALAASFFLILFFSYGHLFALKELYSIRLRYLIGGAVLLFSLGLFFIATTRRDLRVLARSATVFAVFLILFSVLQITVFKIKSAYFSSRYGSSDNIKVVGNGGGPDIYYIMLDGYASSWSLREVYKYDNTPFLNALRDRGFFVVSKSRSNYPNTTFSLPSMLNMDYVENLTSDGLITKESYNYRDLIYNNAALKFLLAKGYTYIHVGSWWDPTRSNPHASVNINKGYMPEFVSTLYKSVAFGPLNIKLFDTRREQYDRIYYQLDQLRNIPKRPESTFTFVHFNMSPYVFDENGGFLVFKQGDDTRFESLLEKYPQQVAFFNREVLKLIDHIRETSGGDYVIILQSDHGSRVFPEEGKTSVDELEDLDIKERLRNLSAVYLPKKDSKDLYESMTNVNMLRVVFNNIFGTNYEILPDRSYINVPSDHYKFVDVTERAKYED